MASLVLVACGGSPESNTAEVAVEVSHNWSEKEVESFVRQCNVIAADFAGDRASEYCDCVRDLILAEEPDPEVAHAMEDHEWMALLNNSKCHEEFDIPMIENKWTDEVKVSFITGCIESASARFDDEEKATNFCECALEKTMAEIPNINYAISMTEEELARISAECE